MSADTLVSGAVAGRAVAGRAVPDAAGHFGRFGGRFVPEALVAALDELDARLPARAGRPRLPGRVRPAAARVRGRAEPALPGDPAVAASWARGSCSSARTSTTPARTRSAMCSGQALLTKRMGKSRVIAETGAGQHGVASATAAALFGLECVVYMGEEDTRRQSLNVARMRMLGATVVPVTTGSRTLKDAMNEAMRDWVTNVDSTHYLIGTVAGPHPFPAMVRDFARGIGVEARAQCLDLIGGCPTRCAPASAAAPTRWASSTPSSRTQTVALYGYEAGGEGIATGPPRGEHHRRVGGRAARHPYLRPAGRGRADGRVALHLGRAGLPRRRAGARLPARHRAGRATSRWTTRRRWRRSSCSAGPRGSSRRSRAPTRWPARPA